MIHRKKILSLLLAASMLMAYPAAYAADNPEIPPAAEEITAEGIEASTERADIDMDSYISKLHEKSLRGDTVPENKVSLLEDQVSLLQEDENLERLDWSILSWELTQGTADPDFSWNDRDEGYKLHTIHEENGSGNFVVLGVTIGSKEAGIGRFTFKRPAGSSYTAIHYSKHRPGLNHVHNDVVVPLDSNGEFSVEVTEEDSPWAYNITYGNGTNEDDFVAGTCTYGFNFQVNRFNRIEYSDVDWNSNNDTVVDADFDFPLSKEFNISCGGFHLYVDKNASSPATANLIFHSPFGNNDHIYARYWSHIPGDHTNSTDTVPTSSIEIHTVPLTNNSVSIPISEADGSLVYNVQFVWRDDDGTFYRSTYTYPYQIYWETEMTWDNISYETAGVTTLSEYKFPAVSDDWLVPYPDYYDRVNWLDVPVKESTGTMTVTVSCPDRLKNIPGLTAYYYDNSGYRSVSLSNGSFTLPVINVSENEVSCRFRFGVDHPETDGFYGYFENMTPEYYFDISFRPANEEDYLPVSITDWSYYGNNNPRDIEVRIHNRKNISGTLIIAAYRENGRLIKAVTAPFGPDTKDWVHADGLAAAVEQATYLKAYAVDSNTFSPLCPANETYWNNSDY